MTPINRSTASSHPTGKHKDTGNNNTTSATKLPLPTNQNGDMDMERLITNFLQKTHNYFNRTREPKESRIVDFPEFKEGNQDPVEWLESFERACQANRVPKERQIVLVASYLKGTTLTCFNRQTIHTWCHLYYLGTSFVHLFKQQFCNPFRISQ
jgi:hypothetical protein